MSKWNVKGTPQVGPSSAITSVSSGPGVTTYEGGQGFTRDSRGELYLLAVSFMGGDDTFYEKGNARYERLVGLVNKVCSEEADTSEWLLPFVSWLRQDVGLRTVSLVIASEIARARSGDGPGVSGAGDTRAVVSAALRRADEPAEMVAYWNAMHGGHLPRGMRMGLTDALIRMGNTRNFLKYGKQKSSIVGMRDVVRLVHPTPRDEDQSRLFSYMTGTSEIVPPMIETRNMLQQIPKESRRAYMMNRVHAGEWDLMAREAGITWEWISEWLSGGMDSEAWEAVIPQMGIFALLRNLRNFDNAGISGGYVQRVQQKLMSEYDVASSGILPFQVYNAYRNVESLKWGFALGTMLTYSVRNVPTFKGNTLVLVDMSGSMDQHTMTKFGKARFSDVAKIFGSVLKTRNSEGVYLYQYGSKWRSDFPGQYESMYRVDRPFHGRAPGKEDAWTGVTKRIECGKGADALTVANKFHGMGGTRTHEAVAEAISDMIPARVDRVILITDEQSFTSRYDRLPVPSGVPVYIWNLAGYAVGTAASGSHGVHVFGGPSDDSFKMIPILESGHKSGWPWEE